MSFSLNRFIREGVPLCVFKIFMHKLAATAYGHNIGIFRNKTTSFMTNYLITIFCE